ncbi:hypothetical protein PUN28_012142 [Cardiocondyla obscurior]|uniref:Uncharacterized protein n=1 Tax=Cardiocondyla obscurior TaxID=286306 RepID=A0AAW2FAY3_9HYME
MLDGVYKIELVSFHPFSLTFRNTLLRRVVTLNRRLFIVVLSVSQIFRVYARFVRLPYSRFNRKKEKKKDMVKLISIYDP